MDDILINKNQRVKLCIKRIKEEYQDDPDNLKNYTKQDSIILNIQRLSEAAIDITVHEYQKLNLEIVEAIIENEIEEIKDFSQKMLQKMAENN